jgi:hypothetical protein
MKTLILLLALISTTLTAQIKTYAVLEGGLTKWSHSVYSNERRMLAASDPVSFYSNMLIGFKYCNFHFENSIETFMNKGHAQTFNPILTEYVANIFYDFGKIKIGYEHSCTHPVFNAREDFRSNMYRASYDKLYFKMMIGND